MPHHAQAPPPIASLPATRKATHSPAHPSRKKSPPLPLPSTPSPHTPPRTAPAPPAHAASASPPQTIPTPPPPSTANAPASTPDDTPAPAPQVPAASPSFSTSFFPCFPNHPRHLIQLLRRHAPIHQPHHQLLRRTPKRLLHQILQHPALRLLLSR